MKTVSLLILTALGGCATAYQPNGFAGGFEEIALAPNVYRVSFKGNGYTGGSRAEELALLRSADLTLQKGFKFFSLADSNFSQSLSSFTTPRTSATNVKVQTYGNTAYGTAQTTYSGGNTEVIVKPRSTNIVVMFVDRPASGQAFEADFICGSIGTKYKTKCGVR